MGKFPEPKEGTVFYDDGRVYACLAFEPKVEGHTIVAWKEEVEDLSRLSPEDYQHLMNVVNRVRNALLKTFETTKVYLAYLDEACHVHWHLLPWIEGGKKGFDLMAQPSEELTDLSKVSLLRSLLSIKM
jgi:diadenosine tetraphosphate (Ap4A) HIT family hydrolase